MDISILKGKILESIEIIEDEQEIIFKVNENEKYRMYHSQDCCENVRIEDINGEIWDLVGAPILMAEEAHHEGDSEEHES